MGKGNPNFGKKIVVPETGEQTTTEEQIETTDFTVSESQNTESATPQETMIPASQIAAIVSQQVAEAIKNIQAPPPAVQTEIIREKLVYEAKVDVNDIPELEDFEVKDRIYVLSNGSKPISFSIRHQHNEHSPLNYTNKASQKVHALRYATNQPSFFTDAQSTEPGSVSVAHITFWDGMLKVPASNITLQKFLAIHPDNGDAKVFKEFDPKERAKKMIEVEDLEFEAKKLARECGDVVNRSIASLVCMGYTNDWDMGDVRAEVYEYLKKEPKKYIDLANNPMIKVKGIARTGVLRGFLEYRNFRWYNEKNEVILEVQRGQDEYDAIAIWLGTGEGRSFYEYLLHSIE